MQVIEFKEFGSPSQLHLAERPLPQADASTAVVRIEAASVNPSDVKNVAGRMSQTTLASHPRTRLFGRGGGWPRSSGSIKKCGARVAMSDSPETARTRSTSRFQSLAWFEARMLSYTNRSRGRDLCDRMVRPGVCTTAKWRDRGRLWSERRCRRRSGPDCEAISARG